MIGRRFNGKAHSEAIDSIIAAWTPERHSALPKAASPSEVPVLIVGMPRCGAALLEQVIASHPEAAPAGETAITRHLVSRLEGMVSPEVVPFSKLEALTPQSVNESAAFYVNTLRMIARRDGYENPQRIVDRCTHNYLYLGMLDRILPKARVIHLRRDPLDTALSCYMNTFDIPYHFRVHPADFTVAYKSYVRLMDHWKGVISMPLLEVDYESLVRNFESETRRIIEFLGLPWNDACLKFWETPRRMVPFSNQGIQKPIYETSAGRHAHYERFLVQLRAALGLPPAEGVAPSASVETPPSDLSMPPVDLPAGGLPPTQL
jgi:hypothetical protein